MLLLWKMEGLRPDNPLKQQGLYLSRPMWLLTRIAFATTAATIAITINVVIIINFSFLRLLIHYPRRANLNLIFYRVY